MELSAILQEQINDILITLISYYLLTATSIEYVKQ